MTTIHATGLDDPEQDTLNKIVSQIEAHRSYNETREAYYEGSKRIRQLGIAIPPKLSDVETVVGWPGMAVDVLDERLDLDGFALPDGDIDDLDLDQVWRDNRMDDETGQAHLPALMHGVCFVTVSAGMEGEPPVLITVEPPTRMSGLWDTRARRLSAAASVVWDAEQGRYTAATLYLADQTIFMEAPTGGGNLAVVKRSEHRLGRPLVVPLVNRPRVGRPWGRSEISRAVISYTDSAVRTLLGMEVAREYYSSPQLALLGVAEEAFQNPDGSAKTAWEVYLGRVLALTRDEDGDLPQVQQISAGSPAPYLDQVRGLANMLAGEAAIPPSYLGFVTDNPSSADAIRVSEARLVKRAERRQRVFGAAWCEVMRLALLVRDGVIPEEANGLVARWRDAATPTRAAQSDSVMKLVSAGVLPPNSEVTYELLGYDRTTINRLAAEARRARTTSMLDSLFSVPPATPEVAGLTQAGAADVDDA
ncbi:phage portal protein [Nocardiopsis alba]|uniref:phage portal protein n=1 Tax=Nocardiopsis alba TaxID=53437 RepID=UPI003D73989D